MTTSEKFFEENRPVPGRLSNSPVKSYDVSFICDHSINDILISAFSNAEKCLPTSKLNHTAKPSWNKYVKEKHTKKILRHISKRGYHVFRDDLISRVQGREMEISKQLMAVNMQTREQKYGRLKHSRQNRLYTWKSVRKKNGGSIIDNCNERCIYDVTYTNDYVIKDFKKRFEKVFKDNNCYKHNELSNDMKRLANDITNDKIQEALERLEN